MVVRPSTRDTVDQPVNIVEVADPEVSYLPSQYTSSSPTVAIVTRFPCLRRGRCE